MTLKVTEVDAIFSAAAELPSAEQRAEYVQRICGDDAELRHRVDELLAAHFAAGDFLERPPAAVLYRDGEDIQAAQGTVIGPYKLLQQIGEGGMGVVFMAEQTEPIQRTVALKIIKPGMDTRQVIARFEAERQALAMMDHPNIAKVLDAGTTGEVRSGELGVRNEEIPYSTLPASQYAGRPYFVMELVKGVPITKYCDERQLLLRERLELFMPVCQAVQHAHQKGIIHRDIKPTNVLVAEYDDHAVPKIIDFGIAKATAQKLTDRTMFTVFGQVIGTVEYMSPEQARFNQLDIDTRSDIYSLGVLLYELLAGSTPFERNRLQHAAFDEALRIIREEDPPRPSTRLSTSDTLPSIAANRHTEPGRLNKEVRGELDWIVMKALEKDRNRRYETANDLAMDVRRYLRDDTVQACPPSSLYRLKKFAQRNKGPLLAASLVLLTMIGGIVGTTMGMMRAEQARRAEAERAEGERRARKVAQEREAESKAVLDFVRNNVFAAARPEGQAGGLGHDVTLRRAVETALPLVEDSFADRPLVQARLQSTLGASFWWLGQPKIAVEQLEKARAIYVQHLGLDHPDTLSCMIELANSYEHAGQYDDALALRQEIVRLSRDRFGPDDAHTIKGMSGVANSYYLAGRYAEALRLREEVLALAKAKFGPDDRNVLGTMQNLANDYQMAGRLDEALALREETLELWKIKSGADHPDSLATMNNLAFSYEAMGRHAEALKLREQTLALSKDKLGPHHRDTLSTMLNLAISYSHFGRHEEALQLEEQTLQVARTSLGPDHPYTLQVMRNLAMSYQSVGRHKDALGLVQQALALTKAKFGPDDPATLLLMGSVAANLISSDRSAEAVPIIDDCLKRTGGKAIDPRLVPTLFDYRLRYFEKIQDAAGCRTTAEMWERLNRTDPVSLYTAACYRAVTAGILRTKDKSDGSAQSISAEADLAMDWLAKAVAAGYGDVSKIEKDNDLDVLREREDFKKLMDKLQGSRESIEAPRDLTSK